MSYDYTLALEQAQRSFDGVAGELPAIRTRAGQILSVSGLAVSFLGGVSTVSGKPASSMTWLVAGAFLVTVLSTGAVLLPKKMVASTSAATLIEWAEQDGATVPKMQKQFALITEQKTAENRKRVDRWSILNAVAIVALLVQIGASLYSVWSR